MNITISERSENSYIINAQLDSGFGMSLSFSYIPTEEEIIEVLTNAETSINTLQ
jgi:hypothetical protein